MKLLSLLCTLLVSVSSAQDLSGLLPDSVAGLRKSDTTRIYVGNGLFNLIDGGADIFKEYGFSKVAVQRYSDSNDGYVDIELYEMKDSAAAYGIFSLVTRSTGERIDFPGEANAGDGFLLFWKGKYYVSLTASISSDDAWLVRAAEEMTYRIPGSGKPCLVSMFDEGASKNQPKLKIAYIRGGLALYNLSTISFGDGFGFVDGICLSTNEAKSFVFTYSTGEACAKNYSMMSEHLKNTGDWDSLYSEPGAGLFGRRKEYLKSVRLWSRIVVSISENKTDVEKMAEEIRGVLTGKSR